jgi:EAL domain-containing protein (putative c-di-GMP-specific phosphodiesterase class I)
MIEVEVTETVFLNRPEDAILQSLHSLKEAGVTIALDDFGTGYASLSHLRQYPVDALKIDRSFTKEVAEDPRQRLITGAVIDLSRTIGIQTVAEGIETDEQADLLEALGCDIGQGYLFGRALCDAEAETLLRNSAARLRGDIVRALRTA